MHVILHCYACGKLERGHTGPAGKYICADCHAKGHRIDAAGNLYEDLRESMPDDPILGKGGLLDKLEGRR